MIDPNSRIAKGYREEYRNKINDRFMSNKQSKADLLGTLNPEELSIDKEREIDEKYRDDIKKFVDELKSDEKFVIYQKKYHEDIQEIRKLLRDVASVGSEKGLESEEDMIKRLFPEAKKAAFDGSYRQWNGFVNKFGKSMRKLKKADKEKILGSLDTIFASKENLQKAMKEMLHGFKALGISDKIESTFMALICLIGSKEFLFGDKALTTIVGAIWILISIHWAQENFKETFIKNASNREVEKLLESHTYDHHNDLPLA